VITLADLAALATTYADDLALEVPPLRIGGQTFDTDARPVVMGVVNLSQDSWYRESVVPTPAAAVRLGRVLAAQGADVVDVGAESVRAGSTRVGPEEQAAVLVPVVEALAAEVAVSVESYSPSVVEACLAAGARVVNLTGSADDAAMFDLAAAHDATVVLCHVLGRHPHDLDGSRAAADPTPYLLETFGARIADARARGVTSLVVDPGVGFEFDAAEGRTRAQHQTRALLHSFRLRSLGVPVCHALPCPTDLFVADQLRQAEPFFAVLARLGGAGVLRTHEVPRIVPLLDALATLGPVTG